MFRRRSSANTQSPGQSADSPEATAAARPAPGGGRAATAGKGRPTPKRSEAERARRPYYAPEDRKEASKQFRDRQRVERQRRNEAIARGEDWALPVRDRGKAKALARDFVDSKLRLSEFYMYGLLVMMALVFAGRTSPLIQGIVPLALIAAVLIMLAEGIYIGIRVRGLVQQRLPDESTRSISLYAAMRALQIRQMRFPKPRVKPGQSF